jgi:hypothetical protein
VCKLVEDTHFGWSFEGLEGGVKRGNPRVARCQAAWASIFGSIDGASASGMPLIGLFPHLTLTSTTLPGSFGFDSTLRTFEHQKRRKTSLKIPTTVGVWETAALPPRECLPRLPRGAASSAGRSGIYGLFAPLSRGIPARVARKHADQVGRRIFCPASAAKTTKCSQSVRALDAPSRIVQAVRCKLCPLGPAPLAPVTSVNPRGFPWPTLLDAMPPDSQ